MLKRLTQGWKGRKVVWMFVVVLNFNIHTYIQTWWIELQSVTSLEAKQKVSTTFARNLNLFWQFQTLNFCYQSIWLIEGTTELLEPLEISTKMQTFQNTSTFIQPW